MPALERIRVSPRLSSWPHIRRRGRRTNYSVMYAAAGSVVTEEMLDVAQQLADAAAAVTTPLFRQKLPIDIKDDKSPVTEADREAEASMRSIIQERLPTHAVFGEEQGFSQGAGGASDFMWVLDPIDGTKAFITGKPSWGSLIALLHKGTPILGIIDQPITQERWIGVQDRQTMLNGELVKARACSDLSKAYMYSTTPLMFSGASEQAYNRLRDQVLSPQYGADCYAYGLLAAGFVDLVVEADMKPWDYLAMVPIIKGAGGVITDWNDRKLSWQVDKGGDSITAWSGEVLAAGDRRAHAEALKALDYSLNNPNV